MQKQIHRTISLSVGIAVLIFGIAAVLVCYRFYISGVKADMRHVCDLLTQEELEPQEIYERLSAALDYDVRVSYFSTNCDILYDSAGMTGSHTDREELTLALENGSGEATRRSESLNRSMYYYAVKYHDGIIRFAREYSGILQLQLIMLTVLFVVGGTMVMISSVISVSESKRLVRPIEQLAKQLEAIDKANGEPIKISSDCEELAPVVARIEELYDRLILQLEDVQKTAQIRSDFSANVSHELKTPLTTIKGFGEMLENGIISNDADVRKYGGTIYRESERLLGLINDIIKLSEVEESAPMREIMCDSDIYTIADEAIKCLEDKARKHDVTVTLSGESCVWRVQDRYMFELITNLVDNAIKYNRPGGAVWVSVSKSPDGDTCVLSVKDNGIGIPAEHQQRIFERFYRVDKSRSKLTGGTGLGLSIVKHITAFHHGTVSLFSRPGDGCEIIVRLPRITGEI